MDPFILVFSLSQPGIWIWLRHQSFFGASRRTLGGIRDPTSLRNFTCKNTHAICGMIVDCSIAQMRCPWCWKIYLQNYPKNDPNVCKYSSTMEYLGCDVIAKGPGLGSDGSFGGGPRSSGRGLQPLTTSCSWKRAVSGHRFAKKYNRVAAKASFFAPVTTSNYQ